MKKEQSPHYNANYKSLNGLKVLLVESNEFNRQIGQDFLESWDIKTDVCSNAESAVIQATKGKYDLILMDIQMPLLDAFTATEKIREYKPHIPILALTAASYIMIQNRAKEVGMNGVISKPFDPEELYNKIVDATNYLNAKHNKIQGFDFSFLDTLTKGSAEKKQKYIDLFLSTMESSMTEFDTAFAELDAQAIKRIIHKQASSLKIVGHNELALRASEIELALEKGSHPEELRKEIAAYKNELESNVILLKKYQKI